MSPDVCIDISNEVCPMTYVRVKLALERLSAGQLLEVTMKGEEPKRNVPRSAADDGHEVVARHENGDGGLTIVIRVGAPDAR